MMCIFILIYAKGMGYDSENLCVPSIRWVGIHITDLVEYRIPLNCTIPLTANDIKHAKELLERPAFQLNSNWRYMYLRSAVLI